MKLSYIFIFLVLVFGINLASCPVICMMPAGINCQKMRLSTDGTLDINLGDGMQKNIHIVGMKCTQESDPTDFEAQDISASMGQIFSPTVPLTCYDSQGIPVGTLSNSYQYGGKIYLKYYFVDEGSANIRTIVGTITVKAQNTTPQWWENQNIPCFSIVLVIILLFASSFRRERNALLQYAIGVLVSLLSLVVMNYIDSFYINHLFDYNILYFMLPTPLVLLIAIGIVLKLSKKLNAKESIRPYLTGAFLVLVLGLLYWISWMPSC